MGETTRLVGEGSSYEAGGNRSKIILVIIVIAVALSILFITLAFTVWDKKATENFALADHVDVANVVGHLNQLYTISTNFSGSRAVQFGYNASGAYVIEQLQQNTDFQVLIQNYTVPIYTQLENPTLNQTDPLQVSYILGTDFIGTRYGGNGEYDITGTVNLAANVGCEETDYNNSKGEIALVFNNGNCTQYEKALLAELAGVSAILIANAPGVTTLSNWRVRAVDWIDEVETPLVQIPVFSISYTLGNTFTKTTTTISLSSNTIVGLQATFNVFALSRSGSAKEIVVAGAHLDGVPEGPGINDNGSGSSSLLEIALQTGPLELENKLLFAWWGAEEIGLLGSRYFVNSLLNHTNLNFTFDQIALDLNFDMLGSPNYILYVHNASTIANPVSINASIVIQNLFERYLKDNDVLYALTPMTGGSDFLPFVDAGIPAGGLATGAGGIKSSTERTIYGGIANAAYDPCYHQSCDTNYNINTDALGTLARTAAYVIQSLGQQANLKTYLWGANATRI